MWLTNLFKKASEIARLSQELDFLTRQKNEIERMLDKSEIREGLLDKALLSERRAKDRVLLRYADQVSKQVGLPQHFVQDAKPKETVIPLELSPDEEARVMWMAEQQRIADLEAGYENVREVEYYAEVIRSDPSKYLLN